MSMLRRRYLQGLFRWKPSEPSETIDLPGEADSFEFLCGNDSWQSAACLDLQWTEEARE